MEDVWNIKIPVELTLKELEDITLALRLVDKAFNGNARSELEDRLSNIVITTKMGI